MILFEQLRRHFFKDSLEGVSIGRLLGSGTG